jgi:hypothetical protein
MISQADFREFISKEWWRMVAKADCGVGTFVNKISLIDQVVDLLTHCFTCYTKQLPMAVLLYHIHRSIFPHMAEPLCFLVFF